MNDKEYASMYSEEESHWWYAGMRSIVLSMLPPGGVPADCRVLDVGCGTGYNLRWIRDNYQAHTTGLDLYPQALTYSRTRGEKDLVRANAADMPFRPAEFDVITAFDVLSHIEEQDARLSALREFHRILKPDGRILLRVAAFEWLRSSHDEEILTRRRYCRSELRQQVSNAGFELLRLTFANSLLFPAAAVWRLLKKAGLAPTGSDVRRRTRGPKWTNALLRIPLRIEAAILNKPGLQLPIGLSLFALARKP